MERRPVWRENPHGTRFHMERDSIRSEIPHGKAFYMDRAAAIQFGCNPFSLIRSD